MMNENDPATTDSGGDLDEKQTGPRTPRTIRFLDSDWTRIEREAKERGISAADLVRHAAVSFATGKLSANPPAFPPEIEAQIERIYRGVYLLSTLKRDEMLHDGQQEAIDRVHKDAHESQAAIIREVAGSDA